jgi:signal transduction histidine kinase
MKGYRRASRVGRAVGALRVRAGRLRPEVADGLLAVAMLIEIELEAWLDTDVPGAHRLPAAIAAVALVAPVVVRRRWPAAALVACAAVSAVLQTPLGSNVLNGITGTILPFLLLAFTVGARLELRRGLGALALASALIVAGTVWSTLAATDTGYSLGAELVGAIVLPAAFWWFGRMSRERARRAAAFRELAARVEREQQEHEHAAIAEERVRIGRELQDIIAQNVSAIIIQAGGACQLIGSEPERARAAILAVELAGREALADLRRTLGLLRADDDPRELAPQPGLSQLDALLESDGVRGLGCKLHVEGARADMTAGVDLLGYRVIEAALLAARTNGHGHGQTEVMLSYRQTRLEIEVHATGAAGELEERLRGIAERVALYDGTMQIEPLTNTGFALKARLPLAAAR